jgi:hypothetical protein
METEEEGDVRNGVVVGAVEELLCLGGSELGWKGGANAGQCCILRVGDTERLHYGEEGTWDRESGDGMVGEEGGEELLFTETKNSSVVHSAIGLDDEEDTHVNARLGREEGWDCLSEIPVLDLERIEFV